ncbi:hypothetical protein ACIBP6_45635 [Nonomuraea terrae]|uniref:hypothetical protein n=1 Tax=Nonomuraea terrae TaxID=2530383 RepID=UPI00379B8292
MRGTERALGVPAAGTPTPLVDLPVRERAADRRLTTVHAWATERGLDPARHTSRPREAFGPVGG